MSWPVVIAGLAMAGLLAAATAIVAISAERASVLAPPSLLGGMPDWLSGPLGGVVPELSRSPIRDNRLFSALVVAMFVLWLVLLATARSLPLKAAVAGVVALHLVLWLAPPLPLTDVFNYLNYGRMGAVHHLNPYVATPATGREYAHDPAGVFTNWHHLRSPYGPLFTLATYPLALLPVPVAYWIFKTAIVAASLGAVALTARCAQRCGRSVVVAIVVMGLSPVAMIWGLGGQHNDSLMVLLVVAAIALWLSGRDGLAAASVVAACAVKPSAAPLVPLFVICAHDRRAALRGTAIAAAVVGGLTLVAFGGHLPDLATQAKMVNTFSIPNRLGVAIGLGGETARLRTAMAAALVVAVAYASWRAWRGTPLLTAGGWMMVASLLTVGWLMRWYVMWLAPFSVLAPSRRLLVALVAISALLVSASLPTISSEFSFLSSRPTAVARANLRFVDAHLR